MKAINALALGLALTVAVVAFPAAGNAGEQGQASVEEQWQQVAAVQDQLYGKRAELESLIANDRRDDPRVQELFKEIGELEGKLFAARGNLRDRFGESGGGAYRRGGRPFRGMGMPGPGYGCCGGGRYGPGPRGGCW